MQDVSVDRGGMPDLSATSCGQHVQAAARCRSEVSDTKMDMNAISGTKDCMLIRRESTPLLSV